MRGRKEVGLPIPGHMVDIPFVTKTFKKIVITLHVYLFLRQLIKNRSIVFTVFLKKAKKLHKNSFLH